MTKKRVLTAAVALSLVTTVLGDAVGGRLRNLVQPVLSPLGDAGMYLTVAIRKNLAGRAGGDTSPEAVARLRGERDQLLGIAAYWMHESDKRKGQLDELLKFQRSYGPASALPCELIPARVVGEPSLPYARTRSLNVGVADGAGAGQVVLAHDRSKALPSDLAVVTASALVGRISGAGAFSAQLRLVTDPEFKTPALIRRIVDPNNPREIYVTEGAASLQLLNESNNLPIEVQAVGNGRGGLAVADVWRYHSVLPGDLLVTREDRFLPLEVRIGRVSEVRNDPDHANWVIVTVQPELDPAKLRNVFIVVPLAGGPAPRGR